ncbi:hypothetical protein [Hydrocarboniphaga effusa]|uniref:hypothetical protein n=1 Tax=Hydrocarboniphaga effusa TaxID=243629 RepID=UPI003BAADF52
MNTITRDSVLNALVRHIGRDLGITARALVVEICGAWSPNRERELRHIVEQLRIEGIAVCADPRAGYHIAKDDAELQQSISFLRKRALTTFRQLRQLQKLARPPMNGQRRLLL